MIALVIIIAVAIGIGFACMMAPALPWWGIRVLAACIVTVVIGTLSLIAWLVVGWLS